MAVLEDLKYIPAESLPKRKRRIKTKFYSEDKLNFLTFNEKRLLDLVDNQHLSFSVIAQSIGCKRQYVHQQYHRIIDKLVN